MPPAPLSDPAFLVAIWQMRLAQNDYFEKRNAISLEPVKTIQKIVEQELHRRAALAGVPLPPDPSPTAPSLR